MLDVGAQRRSRGAGLDAGKLRIEDGGWRSILLQLATYNLQLTTDLAPRALMSTENTNGFSFDFPGGK